MRIRKKGLTGKSGSDSEWIYGFNPVIEALQTDRHIRRIFLSETRHDKIRILKQKAAEKNVQIEKREARFFHEMFPKGHQGIAAEVSLKKNMPIESLLEIPAGKNEVPCFLVLDGIEDVRNFGAILRVADAAGIHGVVIQSYRSAPVGPETSKASAGAVEHVAICRVTNVKHAIREMQKRDILIIGTDAEAEQTIWDADLTVPLAFVIGSEEKGMRKTVKEKCDLSVRIPMRGAMSSLNVSVATGIITFELLRQRLQKLEKY